MVLHSKSRSSSPKYDFLKIFRQIYDFLKIFRQISPGVQKHLQQVYILLCFALNASAIGAYYHIVYNFGGFLTFVASLICIRWLHNTPPHKQIKRVSLLISYCLLHGATLGPLIKLVIDVDPSILVIAFIATAIVFACFSGVALFVRRRIFLYLGGPLSSGILSLIWITFASLIFDGSEYLYQFELYLGILVFIGYIVVDTQEIIQRAQLGDLDYVRDALLLFTDFMCVFSRLLEIMLEEKEEKKKKRRD